MKAKKFSFASEEGLLFFHEDLDKERMGWEVDPRVGKNAQESLNWT